MFTLNQKKTYCKDMNTTFGRERFLVTSKNSIYFSRLELVRIKLSCYTDSHLSGLPNSASTMNLISRRADICFLKPREDGTIGINPTYKVVRFGHNKSRDQEVGSELRNQAGYDPVDKATLPGEKIK